MPKNNSSTDIYKSEDVLLRKRLFGAMNVLYHTYNSILLRRVIKAKRARLDKKIRHNMERNRFYTGRVIYMTPKIILLRALIFLSTLFFRIATKLRSVGRS